MNILKGLKNMLFDTFVRIKNGNDEKVTQEVYNERIDKCNGCTLKAGLEKVNGKMSLAGESGLFNTGNCKICGCFVVEKAKYKDELCPIGKW
jgi:hypothetical protein